MRINDWIFTLTVEDPRMAAYTPPEAAFPVLQWPGGMFNLSRISHREGEVLVSYRGNRYEIGEPTPEYEAAHPNARQRILDNFQEKSSA